MRGLSDAIFRAIDPMEILDLTRARRFRHVPGAVPGIADIFDWSLLEVLVARDLETDNRFNWNGRPLPREQMIFIDEKGRFDADAFQALVQDGVSIIFNKLEQRSTDAWREAAKLEQALQAVVEVGIIASFGEGRALDVHYDPMDLIVVQLAGSKRWHFHGQPVPGPTIMRKELDPGPVTAELTLQAGDVLFVPAGLHHQCLPLDNSLHAGFMLRRPDGRTFMRRILDQIRDNHAMGTQIPAFEDAEMLKRWETGLKEEMIALIRAGNMSDFLVDWYKDWRKPDRRGLFETEC
ncbi:JmjC domain-containing protein [Niveispirillum sp. KHB5.9]|uniref:JmjC domain-containing protein n=1 Tax=Niveispirillum sp. KHB5.9 TaxID=3400269 RepID=UPI003A88CCEC